MYWGFDNFIKRWLQKADGYADAELAELFDKFFTLYVVFNALYDETFNQMLAAGQVAAGDSGERQRAVTHLARFLGPDQLARELKAKADELSQIEQIIRERKFYFNVKGSRREPDWAADKKLSLGIRSSDPKVCCESILSLIYRTRCNMFHGQKAYDSEQANGLRPMNVLLRTTIDMSLRKLGILGSS